MTTVALIPAHNEQEGVGACIDALLGQTVPPDEIIVIADNCTDWTVEVARAHGVRVIETIGNRHKKAGALNQAIDLLGDDVENVLVVDADSILTPGFCEAALDRLAAGYSACGGNFRGQEGAGFLGMCQRNEYARYARDVARLKGKALVLTGTATMFRREALRSVAVARDARLPGEHGYVYDTHVLTEDNELTFALRTLGHKVISPKGCTLTTEVMPTWRALAKQRLRWKRGAFENLRQYGFNRLTAPYWGRQVLSFFGLLVTAVYLLTLMIGAVYGFQLHPFWLALSAIFAVERAVTVRERGWKHMLCGLALLPEMFYDVFLQAVQAYAYAGALLRRKEDW